VSAGSSSLRLRPSVAGWLLVATSAVSGAAGADDTAPVAAAAAVEVPAWLYPMNPPAAAASAAADDAVHLPGTTVVYREAELKDLYVAPDWRPDTHGPMPPIVARGRRPAVYACGHCHSPSGQGRPENASLAGLPAEYMVRQVADMRSGARRSAWHGPYSPPDKMAEVARQASDEEVATAAAYFAQQTLQPRTIVVERATVPRMSVVGFVWVADRTAGEEPIDGRLLETAPDPLRHERRDDTLRYLAYVPPGSLARGEAIARSGGGVALACTGCHGQRLQGSGTIPPLAGRSPTYLLRQLVAFRSGARAGTAGRPMQPVVAALGLSQMIDVAAYAASLPP
jgi:cytochrome c553